MDIKRKTFKRALNMLDALGAIYGVEFEGKAYGRSLAAPKPARSITFNNATKHNFVKRLDALPPGGEDTFPCDSPEEAKSLRTGIAFHALRSRGRGGVVTHYDRTAGTVSVLAILPLKAKLSLAA